MESVTLPRSVLEKFLETFEEVAQWESAGDEAHPAAQSITALRAALELPKVESVPVAWLRDDGRLALNDGGFFSSNWTPLYKQTPSPRLPLTEERIFEVILPLCKNEECCRQIVSISLDEYRAIERAHGIGHDE